MNKKNQRRNIVRMVVTILITIAFVFLVTYQYRIENNDKNTEVSSPVTTSINTTTTIVTTTTTEPTTVITTTKKIITTTEKITEPPATEYIEEEEKYVDYEDEEEEEYIEPNYNSDVYYSPSEFQFQGVIWYNGLKWTYYSDYVLEGSGLDIPGRHYDENNYICDSNGYIVLASCDYAKGTILNTPLGKQGKIYDYCPTSGIVDVYVHW